MYVFHYSLLSLFQISISGSAALSAPEEIAFHLMRETHSRPEFKNRRTTGAVSF